MTIYEEYNEVTRMAQSEELVLDCIRLRKLPFGEGTQHRKRKGYKINPRYIIN